MVSFIDVERKSYGVEPICKVLPIAPSTYFEQKARQADPSRLPARAKRDALLQAGIEPSVGSLGDSYDNALAESIIGLYRTEVIRQRGPWRSLEAVEFATLEWVDWFNNRRLLEPIGHIPPVEREEAYYQAEEMPVRVAGLR